MTHDSNTITASYTSPALSAAGFEDEIWQQSQPITIAHYWSGEPASPSRHAEARICWSNEALHVRFVGNQKEPLIVGENPRTDKKTLGLWDRDVCEIFLAPDPSNSPATLNSKRRRPASGSISELPSHRPEE